MQKSLCLIVVLLAVVETAYGCGDPSDNALLLRRSNRGSGSESSPAPIPNGGDSNPNGGDQNETTGGLSPAPARSAPVTPPPSNACIPPSVQAMLAAKCISCHASPPINGSLSALVTLSDLLAASKEDPTKNEAQLSVLRMKDTKSPMPPGGGATAADISALEAWIAADYTSTECNDGGTSPPPPPATDVFTDAPAFASQTAGNTHNAGKNCMSGCHNHGFTFAGTVTNGAGGGVAGAEVRLIDANGKAISVYTSSNGNFHSSSSWTAPAKIGVRNADAKAIMITALAAKDGGCNGCHANGGTQTPIHLP